MTDMAEWGMQSIQMLFPQIKDWFIYEEQGEQRIVMKLLVLLYNMQAWTVGINQIKKNYMLHLNRNAT